MVPTQTGTNPSLLTRGREMMSLSKETPLELLPGCNSDFDFHLFRCTTTNVRDELKGDHIYLLPERYGYTFVRLYDKIDKSDIDLLAFMSEERYVACMILAGVGEHHRLVDLLIDGRQL